MLIVRVNFAFDKRYKKITLHNKYCGTKYGNQNLDQFFPNCFCPHQIQSDGTEKNQKQNSGFVVAFVNCLNIVSAVRTEKSV